MSTRRISDDPGGWSDDRLEAHAREWLGLPLLECKQVMGDYDAEAHGDLLYIRGLIESLSEAKADLQQEIKDFNAEYGQFPQGPLMWLHYLCHSAEACPVTRWEFSEPWPEDRAGVLLDAWRNEGEAAA